MGVGLAIGIAGLLGGCGRVQGMGGEDWRVDIAFFGNGGGSGRLGVCGGKGGSKGCELDWKVDG